jgi:hypothetical protein
MGKGGVADVSRLWQAKVDSCFTQIHKEEAESYG